MKITERRAEPLQLKGYPELLSKTRELMRNRPDSSGLHREDILETYNTNKAFKSYVDKYCKEYGKTPEKAVQDKIVQEVEEQYKKNAASVADYRGQFMDKFTEVQ